MDLNCRTRIFIWGTYVIFACVCGKINSDVCKQLLACARTEERRTEQEKSKEDGSQRG